MDPHVVSSVYTTGTTFINGLLNTFYTSQYLVELIGKDKSAEPKKFRNFLKLYPFVEYVR